MKCDSFTAKVEMMSSIYQAEAAERPDVTHVDIWELFQDENDAHATFLPDETGELVKMGSADNAHFYRRGAYRPAGYLPPVIAADWGFSLS